jgi:hypothetical protein
MKSFTINAAADLLERDRRTVARSLRGIPPDHRDAQGRERWRLPTIVGALAASGRGDSGNDAVIDEIVRAGEAVEDLLQQLRTAGNIEAARKLMRKDDLGRRIGALDRALERGLAGLRPAEARLLDIVRNQIVGSAIGEVMDLCAWQLAGAS